MIKKALIFLITIGGFFAFLPHVSANLNSFSYRLGGSGNDVGEIASTFNSLRSFFLENEFELSSFDDSEDANFQASKQLAGGFIFCGTILDANNLQVGCQESYRPLLPYIVPQWSREFSELDNLLAGMFGKANIVEIEKEIWSAGFYF